MLVAEAENVRHVVVLGDGIAGLVAIERNFPEIRVTVVRSSQLGVIRVDGGTISSVVRFLHNYLNFDTRSSHSDMWFNPVYTAPGSGSAIV